MNKELIYKYLNCRYLSLFCVITYEIAYIYSSYVFYKACHIEGFDILADLAVNITVSNETYYSHEVRNLLPIWVFPLIFAKVLIFGFIFGTMYNGDKE